jgi:hypothetical protein
MYAELVYFERAHFAHIVALAEHRRLEAIRKRALELSARNRPGR